MTRRHSCLILLSARPPGCGGDEPAARSAQNDRIAITVNDFRYHAADDPRRARAACASTLVNRGRLAHTFRRRARRTPIVAKVSSLLPGDRASKRVPRPRGRVPVLLRALQPRGARHVRHADRQVRAVEPDRFRAVMGHFATGVAVVTVDTPAGPQGMTANAVASLSLDPVLVLVCFDNGARTLPEVERAKRFGVNVLAAGQEHLARRFASKEDSKFADVPHSVHDGIPVLDGTLAWVGCDLERLVPGRRPHDRDRRRPRRRARRRGARAAGLVPRRLHVALE